MPVEPFASPFRRLHQPCAPALLQLGFCRLPAQTQDGTSSRLRRTTPHASAALADKKLNARVDALLAQMTLEEKIGQLAQYTGGSTITGPTGEKLDFDAMLAKGEIGSLFNVTGAKETNHYQHIAVEKSRLHIPLLFGLDVIHGHRTTFPVPLAMASSFDPDIVQQACRVAADGGAAGRHQLGVLADGGHLARCALGTHR